jgi:hypothetical protein
MRPKVCRNGAAAPEDRRSRQGKRIVDMLDLNRISAANTNRPDTILSKNRTNLDVEVSSQSTHFTPAVNATVNTLTMPTADETWSEAGLRRGLSATR